MNKEYVYLRNTVKSKGNISFSASDTDAVIETAELSKKDIADLKRDPSIIAGTPNIPTELIKPVAAIDHENNSQMTQSFVEQLEQMSGGDIQETSECTWGISAVRADQSRYTGKGAVIAILDTGIDLSHERFTNVNIETNNFTEDSSGDVAGHGTHCAGTVFGQEIEGCQRIGVAPDIETALIGKVLGDSGSGSTAWVAQGIEWAASSGADVISMSLGSSIHGNFEFYTQELGYTHQNALSMALDDYFHNLKFYSAIAKYNQSKNQEAIIIAASGNESGRLSSSPFDAPCGLPAIADEIISVGALGMVGDMFPNVPDSLAALMTVAPFSNYNNNISAPGNNIYSSLPNNQYEAWNGTSMATPHVTGIAALWVQKQLESLGYVDAQMLRHQLQGTASMESIINSNADYKIDPSDFGVGLVQAPL